MRDMPEFQCSVPLLRMQRSPSRAREKSGKSVADFARHNSTNPRGLCCEAAPEERASISTTINRELTPLNDSFGSPESGADLWDEICGRAYRVQHAKNGTTYRKRCGEADTISVAFILHPPSYVTAGWDKATALDFEHDALESMNDVMASLGRPRIFCEQNLVGRYFHWDEGDRAASAEYAGLGLNPRDLGEEPDDPATVQGWHAHDFCMCQDPETGRWVGKQMDALFRTRLAKDFPRLMRGRGWPVLDNDVTDYSKTARRRRARDADGRFLRREDGSYVMEDNPDYDPDYAARRKRRAKRQGRSQNEFHSEQVARNLMRASDQLARQNQQAKADLDELTAKAATAKADLDGNLAELDRTMALLAEYEGRAKKAEGEADEVRAKAKADAELTMRQAKHAAERTLAEADEIHDQVVAEADDIELEAHYTTAGEQEAIKQIVDAAEDQLNDMSERAAELERQSEQANASLAAATRRREDEEAKAEEAERKRRASERQRQASEHAKARADADAAKARRDSAEATRLAGELDKIKADTAEATKQRDKTTAECDAANSARDMAKAEAEQAKTDAATAVKQRDKARADAKSAKADAATAAKQRDVAKREAAVAKQAADTAKQAQADAEKAQADAEASAKEAKASYDEVAADVSAKQAEYDKVEDAIASRRDDLEVVTRRGTFKLSAVVSKAIEVCADALELVVPKAAQWLRDRADALRERAIDAVAPETKGRRLADYDGPELDDDQDELEVG